MTSPPRPDPRVGRILTDSERVARMAAETSPAILDEVLRTAFTISEFHLLTAWHCVRDIHDKALWFRIRIDNMTGSQRYIYLPVKLCNHHEQLDVAVLSIDGNRLDEGRLTEGHASSVLREAMIPLSTQVDLNDLVRVAGFPVSAPSSDNDISACAVVALAMPFGGVKCLKLFGPAFAAVDPVDPHGLSGGPVLHVELTADGKTSTEVAIGIVRAVPIGWTQHPQAASGGGLLATHIHDAAGVLTEVHDALTKRSKSSVLIPSWVQESLLKLNNLAGEGILLDNRELRSLRKAVVLDYIFEQRHGQGSS